MRMPEGGRCTAHRPRGGERENAQEKAGGSAEHQEAHRTSQRLESQRATKLELCRVGAVCQLEQRTAGVGGGGIEQRSEGASAPGAQLLQTPGDPRRGEPAVTVPRQPRNRRNDQPRNGPRGQNPIGHGYPAKPEQPGQQSKYEHRGAQSNGQPGQAGAAPERTRQVAERCFGSGHPPYPTAYAKRLTPIRSAASRLAGGSS
jgi:hypothetical protein